MRGHSQHGRGAVRLALCQGGSSPRGHALRTAGCSSESCDDIMTPSAHETSSLNRLHSDHTCRHPGLHPVLPFLNPLPGTAAKRPNGRTGGTDDQRFPTFSISTLAAGQIPCNTQSELHTGFVDAHSCRSVVNVIRSEARHPVSGGPVSGPGVRSLTERVNQSIKRKKTTNHKLNDQMDTSEPFRALRSRCGRWNGKQRCRWGVSPPRSWRARRSPLCRESHLRKIEPSP